MFKKIMLSLAVCSSFWLAQSKSPFVDVVKSIQLQQAKRNTLLSATSLAHLLLVKTIDKDMTSNKTLSSLWNIKAIYTMGAGVISLRNWFNLSKDNNIQDSPIVARVVDALNKRNFIRTMGYSSKLRNVKIVHPAITTGNSLFATIEKRICALFPSVPSDVTSFLKELDKDFQYLTVDVVKKGYHLFAVNTLFKAVVDGILTFQSSKKGLLVLTEKEKKEAAFIVKRVDSQDANSRVMYCGGYAGIELYAAKMQSDPKETKRLIAEALLPVLAEGVATFVKP